MVRLSYSRISTLLTCSYSYYMSYFLKGPRGTSVPTSLGSTTHYVLECLGKDKRRKYSKEILEKKSAYCIPSIERLVKIHCRKFDMLTDENLGKINGFILVALNNDFYGQGCEKIELEKEFDIKTDRYHIYGFIDALYYYKDKVKIKDFKTGASKPSKDSIPIQAMLYELVQKIENPHLKREIEFQYLKFSRAAVVKHEESSDEKLAGFEEWLSYLSKYMEDFTPAQACSNMAKNNGNHFLCGKVGFKDNNESLHLCQWKHPRAYFILMDENGKQIGSSFLKKDLDKKLKSGYSIQQSVTAGCPAWKHEWESK